MPVAERFLLLLVTTGFVLTIAIAASGTEAPVGTTAETAQDENLDEWFGIAWIDLETGQFLRIEAWEPTDHESMQKMERHLAGEAASPWTYGVRTIRTEFTAIAHGLRFPGEVELLEEHTDVLPSGDGWASTRETSSEVWQTYDDYEFFGVSTEESLVGPD